MLSLLLAVTLAAQAAPPPPCAAALEKGVRVGADDSWFASVELDSAALDTSDASLAPLRAILKAFADQGVLVVGIPTPDRPLLKPEELQLLPGDTWDGAAAIRGYEALVATFAERGVGVDLLPVARATPGYFFLRDPHLTPAGMEATARAVAELVLAHPAASDLPPAVWKLDEGPEAKSGNISRAVTKACDTTVPDEVFRSPILARTDIHAAASSLFGESTAQVVVLGTSQSEPRLNLGGYLARALQTPVDIYAVSDGGAYAPLLTYLQSDAWRDHPPRVILWEFPLWSVAPPRPGAQNARPALADPAVAQMALPMLKRACDLHRLPSALIPGMGLIPPTPIPTMDPVSAFALSFASPTKAEVQVELYDASGPVTTVDFPSWRRMPPRTLLTWQLAEPRPLDRLQLRVKGEVSGQIELRLCR